MKKNVIKTAIAAVCVVAAGMGGFKAYNVANQSQAAILLAENIDALSAGDGADGTDDGWEKVPAVNGKCDTGQVACSQGSYPLVQCWMNGDDCWRNDVLRRVKCGSVEHWCQG